MIEQNKLQNYRIALFGVGGVGGYAADTLIRSGIGVIDVFDNDTVSITNLNRQIIATQKTIGQYKVDVIKEYCETINPDVLIHTHRCFYMPDNADDYDLSQYDYIIDAIDTVTAKIELIVRAKALNIPIISCMGTGNKLDAAQLEVSDIYQTSVCPLAKVMRYELRRRGIKSLKVVYSKEKPIKPHFPENYQGMRNVPGSTAFVPAVAGIIAASTVISDISK